MAMAPSPVTLELDAPLTVARWRPLVHWLLALPHLLVLYVLQNVLTVLTIVAFFTILFTGGIPGGLFDFMVLINRYQWRVWSYVLFLREEYPPFDFAASADDPGTDPARLAIERPGRLSRGLPFVKWLLAVPHYVALFFLGVAAVVAAVAGGFAVLFTGAWPPALRDFLVGVTRWSVRVQAYVMLLTDAYPPFSLQ